MAARRRTSQCAAPVDNVDADGEEMRCVFWRLRARLISGNFQIVTKPARLMKKIVSQDTGPLPGGYMTHIKTYTQANAPNTEQEFQKVE